MGCNWRHYRTRGVVLQILLTVGNYANQIAMFLLFSTFGIIQYDYVRLNVAYIVYIGGSQPGSSVWALGVYLILMGGYYY